MALGRGLSLETFSAITPMSSRSQQDCPYGGDVESFCMQVTVHDGAAPRKVLTSICFCMGLVVAILTQCGCANHPLDCSLGIAHPDCLPGTAGYQTIANRQENADALCQSYGLRFGTAEYAQCRQNQDAQQSARQTAALGALLSQNNRPPPVTSVPAAPQPSQTSCVTNGQYTHCQSQ